MAPGFLTSALSFFLFRPSSPRVDTKTTVRRPGAAIAGCPSISFPTRSLVPHNSALVSRTALPPLGYCTPPQGSAPTKLASGWSAPGRHWLVAGPNVATKYIPHVGTCMHRSSTARQAKWLSYRRKGSPVNDRGLAPAQEPRASLSSVLHVRNELSVVLPVIYRTGR